MAIWNLTDKEEDVATVYDILGHADIKCYKGDRKTGSGENTRPGRDLKEKIRVVTGHRLCITHLTDYYGKPKSLSSDPFDDDKPQGDWYVDELNIYLALDDIDMTFETSMKAFDGTGVLLMCDRRTINKEAKTISTHKGERRVLKNCSKPCALSDHDDEDWDCPLGCKPSGILHFYIRECLDNDVMVHAQFETKAFGDVPNLIKRLRSIKRELGSLTQSPYPCFWTRHKIPMILSRVERSRKRPDIETRQEGKKKTYLTTGKKCDAKFYDLDLQVDPVWMDWYKKQKLVEEMHLRGLTPGKDIVAGLMTGDIVDVKAIASSVIELPALPPHPEPVPAPTTEPTIAPIPEPISKSQRQVTDDQFIQLEDALMRNNWDRDAIALLLADFQIDNPKTMTQEQWVQVCAIASSPQSAREYNDAALAPPMPTTISQNDWLQTVEPVFRQNNWFPSKDGKEDKRYVFAMLQSEYGISRLGELMKTHIPELLELAASSDVRDRWVP